MNIFLVMLLVFEGVVLAFSLSGYHRVNKHPELSVEMLKKQREGFSDDLDQLGLTEEDFLRIMSGFFMVIISISLVAFVITFITLI